MATKQYRSPSLDSGIAAHRLPPVTPVFDGSMQSRMTEPVTHLGRAGNLNPFQVLSVANWYDAFSRENAPFITKKVSD